MKRLVLCLDISESMGYGEPSKLKQAVEAAVKTVEALRSETLTGLVVFDSEPEVLLEPKRVSPDEVREILASLRPRGVSRIAAGLEKAVTLASSNGEVVLISDGRANLSLDRSIGFEGLVELEQELIDIAKKASQNRVKIHTIAVGEDSFTGTLKALSNTSGGQFYLAETFLGLAEASKPLIPVLTLENLTVYPAPAELPEAQPTWTRESQMTHVAVVSDRLYEAYGESRVAVLRNPVNGREARVALQTVESPILAPYRGRRAKVVQRLRGDEAILLDRTYRDFLLVKTREQVNLTLYRTGG